MALPINTGTYNENGWVDVLSAVPGSLGIWAWNTNLLRRSERRHTPFHF